MLWQGLQFRFACAQPEIPGAFMIRWINSIIRHPKKCMAVLILVVGVVATFGRKTEFDPSLKSFILEDDSDYVFYNEYKEKFGQDEILCVAFRDGDIFTSENLALIRRLTKRIEDVDNIYDVKSLTNAEYILSTEDSFEAVPLVDEIPEGERELAKVQYLATSNPIFRNDLVSADGRSTSIVITLAAKGEAYLFHDEIRKIEAIVKEESARSGKQIHFTGERYMDLRFLEFIHRDLKIFIPLTTIVLALLLFLMFRNVRETLIGLVAVSACLLMTGGLIPLLGQQMNSILAGLPSLILCIAVTDVIHIIHRYKMIRPGAKSQDAALKQTIREVALPCLLTSATTAVGFGSLMMNAMQPIQSFGLMAAVGVSLCFPICIVAVFSMLKFWKEPVPKSMARAERTGPTSGSMAFLGMVVTRYRKQVGLVSLALVAFCMVGFLFISAQANRASYLKKESDVYQAIHFMDEYLAGTTQLDICIEGGGQGAVKEPVFLRKVEELSRFLRSLPEIDKVISINDFLKEMNKAYDGGNPASYVLPASRDNVAQFLLLYSMSGRNNELDKYVNYPYSRTRLSVRTSEENSDKINTLIGKINGYLETHFEEPQPARLAAVAVTYNNVFHYLLKGLLVGLGLATLIVGLVMCITFRSVYIGLVSMIPNVIPIIASLGLLGWADVKLHIATAMTFSIALGIAVDDTIHFFSRFKLELDRCGDYERAIKATLANIGSALVETSCVISGGFLIMVFASTRMNVMFGLLAAFIMAVTLLADLFITPVCLQYLRPFKMDNQESQKVRKKNSEEALSHRSAHSERKQISEQEALPSSALDTIHKAHV